MELKTAICPACKKQIEVDALEVVDFCKHCGKPLNTQDAIKLYTDSVANDKNSRKPAQEVTDKFDAILKHDCILAKQYLDSVVQKDYPDLFSKRPLQGVKSLDEGLTGYHIYSIESDMSDFYPLNKHLADMYYRLLCALTNALINKKCGKTFNGEMPYLKLRLGYIVEKLDEIVEDISMYNRYPKDSAYGKKWFKFEEDIKHCEQIKAKQGYDNKYLKFTMDEILKWSHEEVPVFTSSLNDKKLVLHRSYIVTSIAFRKEGCEMRDILALVRRLENFLSPGTDKPFTQIDKENKEKAAQKAKEKEKAEREEKYNKAYNEELEFWTKYIDLLKRRKASDALKLLERKKTRVSQCKAEMEKFKNVLFSVKYTGDVAELDAEAMARRATEHLKPAEPTTTDKSKQK